MNQSSNEYLSLLPQNPFLGEYVPLNAQGKRLEKSVERRDAVMQLRYGVGSLCGREVDQYWDTFDDKSHSDGK